MAPPSCGNSSETTRLLERVAAGELWGELLTRHQQRLRALVSLRLDHRLQGRIDPSDVIQESYLEVFSATSRLFERPVDPVLFMATLNP